MVYVPAIRPPSVLANSGLVDDSGWVRVDRHTLETRFPGVYAGNFYAESRPTVRMRRPGWFWHAGKVLFEKQAMWQWL